LTADTAAPVGEGGACRRCGQPLPAAARFCPACGWRVGPLRLSWTRERYWRILLVGFVLYVVAAHGLRATGNVNLLPTVLLLGSFLVPVTYVAFLYENEVLAQMPLTTLTAAFFLGGVLGSVAASEAEMRVALVAPALFGVLVGFIEEAAKLLGVVWWLPRRELQGEAYGLVLGAAAGMGFAALETMGYGLVAFVHFGGDLRALGEVLTARGLLSPLAHGTWTAILAAVLWREKAAGRPLTGRPVVRTYLFVSVLHGLWDLAGSGPHLDLVLPFVRVPLSTLVIGAIGLWALHLRMAEGQRTAPRP
jgi:RsiW-degrading membrane proteinase PrsW (M82 family)